MTANTKDIDQADSTRAGLVRPDVLPTGDGGGIVFPDGFLGSGFRLGPTDFAAYVSVAEATRAAGKEAQPSWSAIWASLLCLLATATSFWIVGGGLALFFPPDDVIVRHPDIAGTAIILACALTYFYVAWRLIRSTQSMRQRFSGAEALAPFAFWQAHVLAAVIAQPRHWSYRCLFVFFLTVVGFAKAWDIQDLVPYGIFLTVAFGIIAAVGAVWSAAFMLAAQQFGRSPTAEDLRIAIDRAAEAEAVPAELSVEMPAIPAKDGGGIVYPDGFAGYGYRLNAEDFAACIAAQPKQSPKLNGMGQFVVTLLFLTVLGLFIWAMTALDIRGLIDNNMLSLAVLAGLAALTLYRWLQGLLVAPGRLQRRYPSARRLPYWARWRDRVLARATCAPGDWKWTYLGFPLLVTLVAYNWLSSGHASGDIQTGTVILAIAFGLCYIGARVLVFGGTYWLARLRLGHAPTKEDIKPA